jgi:hypothetical protein
MVAEKEQHAKAVQEAKRIIDVKKHTTKAEVARLKGKPNPSPLSILTN